MDGTGPRQPLTPRLDEQVHARSGQVDWLDRELESTLGVEPSPEFLARVRTRVAAEPEPASWRLAIRRWSFEPLAVVAVAGIVLAVVVPNLMRDGGTSAPNIRIARELSGAIRGMVEELPPVSRGRVAVPAARRLVRHGEADLPTSAEATVGKHVGLSEQVDAVHVLPLKLSPVMFSEGEQRALIALVNAVEEGRVPPVPAVTDANGQRKLRELHIDPLVVEPLPQLARLEIGAL